jgi:hypothetical protein
MTINSKVLMADTKWSTTVLIIMATPGMEARYELPDLSDQYPGSDAYLSFTGTAGSACVGRGCGDSWCDQDDTAEGIWFGSSYIGVPEGTLLGYVHVASIVSAGHLRDVITALDDSMWREEPAVATRFPEETCLKVGSQQRFVMWPDRVITKTIREQSYAHRFGPGFTDAGPQPYEQ